MGLYNTKRATCPNYPKQLCSARFIACSRFWAVLPEQQCTRFLVFVDTRLEYGAWCTCVQL